MCPRQKHPLTGFPESLTFGQNYAYVQQIFIIPFGNGFPALRLRGKEKSGFAFRR